ncbi:bifunctional adenosylcobinamide kinase/adenosylcobinamide-phosphate guanylyltransferase [Lentibacillus jeotgali]|uniref:bifunctional adenosylcobinamide kinase/adenosylcobinamide-phosphate guanylyltransferase n=1 Tax=Lentibacillus jeotgali TaxID=558169 RepID=UPI0002627C23|nr:bifunctional adenosylcobinamide kinase/adenosylcobinamide-phosphate guanylyltransferase [Lentibacillus jeotgali]
METGKLIFVTGGSRSGKTSYAEKMAIDLGQDLEANLHYIACSDSIDMEMSERIARHRRDRENAPVHWETWECPYNVQRIARHFSKRDILVLDCVTTLLDNYLYELMMKEAEWLIDCLFDELTSLQEASSVLIVVSNEVTQEVPFKEQLIKKYQYILGSLHQKIVYQADTAYLVENGLPICKKGAAE